MGTRILCGTEQFLFSSENIGNHHCIKSNKVFFLLFSSELKNWYNSSLLPWIFSMFFFSSDFSFRLIIVPLKKKKKTDNINYNWILENIDLDLYKRKNAKYQFCCNYFFPFLFQLVRMQCKLAELWIFVFFFSGIFMINRLIPLFLQVRGLIKLQYL